MIQELLYNYIYILINIILTIILILNTKNILNINTYYKYILCISKEYFKYYILY